MSILKFSDGMQFNTDGNLRVVEKWDGFYVVGKGRLIPVNDYEEGRKLIKELNKEQ